MDGLVLLFDQGQLLLPTVVKSRRESVLWQEWMLCFEGSLPDKQQEAEREEPANSAADTAINQ